MTPAMARGGVSPVADKAPDVTADAPGRVNLMGEHTDYNGGFVLPVAIPQRTWVALTRREDRQVRVSSTGVMDPVVRSFALGGETRTGSWVDYVQGVTVALAARGFAIGGFDATIRSTVPVGSGLSSSAALEVSLLRALREAFALPLDDVLLAQVARAAETDFVGAPVGIMDQMASSLADERAALFLDTRTLVFERVPLPASIELVVIDSGVAHDHATGDYRTRRAECERAASGLGVSELRDVDLSRLAEMSRLEPPLGRRARHVVTENARVLEAVECLRSGDVESLGRLFMASHASMRDDFEVSVPAVDRLVEVATAHPDILGARLTGGGFGGAIVALAQAGSGRHAGAAVTREVPGARLLVPGDAS